MVDLQVAWHLVNSVGKVLTTEQEAAGSNPDHFHLFTPPVSLIRL